MVHTSITPHITVTIGGQTRLYHAFVTTALPAVDGPSTMTLYTAALADVGGLAAEPIAFDAAQRHVSARLVLIETRELAWLRARYRAEGSLCVPVDPVLVGLSTLQHWLWHRLQAPAPSEVHA